MTEPRLIKLNNWSVFEVITTVGGKTESTIHIVGTENAHTGRVSPPILTMNRKTKTFKCNLGDEYQIDGNPGRTVNSDFVFKRWIESIPEHTLKEITDVFA